MARRARARPDRSSFGSDNFCRFVESESCGAVEGERQRRRLLGVRSRCGWRSAGIPAADDSSDPLSRAEPGAVMTWWWKRRPRKPLEVVPPQQSWNEDTREVQALVDRSRAIEAESGWATTETSLLRTV